MKVERRQHPRGEKGTRTSIDEVAKRAAEGRLDPRTRAWAIEKIVQAGNPKGILDRAAAILDALRRERIYVEDPTDAEFIPSAACTLHGCEGLKFLGEDCDGLLVSFLAAIGSIGIWGAVVGHSYDDQTGQISHVLAGVFDGEKWPRCDPSTKQPFGVVSKAARERWVAIHDGRVICDQAHGGCGDGQIEQPMQRMRPSGEFVGVGRPAANGTVGGPMGNTTTVLVPSTMDERRTLADSVAIETGKLVQSLDETRIAHARLVALRDELDKPLTDVDVTKAPSLGYEQLAGEGSGEVSGESLWSQEDEDRYNKTVVASEQLILYGHEVVAGSRDAGYRQDDSEIVILGKPDEPKILVSKNAEQAMLMNFEGQPRGTALFYRPATGQVGLTGVEIALVAGVLVILAGITAYLFYHDSTQLEQKKLDNAAVKDLKEFYNQRRAAGDSHEDALAAVNSVNAAAVRRAQAQTEASKQSALGQISDTVQTIMWAAFGVGVVYVGGYTLVALLQRRSRQQITGIPILASHVE